MPFPLIGAGCATKLLLVSRVGGRNAANSLRSVHSEDIKTRVQEYGWEYLKHQQKLGRPLSPHLNIYKPQLTWLISGGHRIAGCVMTGTLMMGVGIFAIFDYASFIERIRSWELPWPVTASAKFIIAWTVVFHTLNGIRFICFDLAKFMELKQIYLSGYLVLALSTLIALYIVANAKRITTAQIKAQQMAE